MPSSLPRSLKHEYELYVEREIENYKDSVPRHVLLSLGDEAVRVLSTQPQFELTELVLWEEVDRIIKQRLRVPSYATWRRRRLRTLEKYRRPEHWGLEPHDAIVRALPANEGHVLLAGSPKVEETALYLAANGVEVTALEQEEDVVERVMTAAAAVGLTGLVHGCVSDLGHWSPESPLAAVVCTPSAFDGLSRDERERVIGVLQGATLDGGIHLVETLVAGQAGVTIDELRTRYDGWSISIERGSGDQDAFVAQKSVS